MNTEAPFEPIGRIASSSPPGDSKQKEVRYLDIHEDDKIDEKQLATWIKQAASIPGWAPSQAVVEVRENGGGDSHG